MDHLAPFFLSHEEEKKKELPLPFKYDLRELYPVKGCANDAVWMGKLHFFSPKHKVMVERYLALNRIALCMYDSMASFVEKPAEPLAAVPLKEIAELYTSHVRTLHLLSEKLRSSTLGSQHSMNILTIKLRKPYEQI